MEYVYCILPQGLQSKSVLKGNANNSKLLRTYFRKEQPESGANYFKRIYLN